MADIFLTPILFLFPITPDPLINQEPIYLCLKDTQLLGLYSLLRQRVPQIHHSLAEEIPPHLRFKGSFL